MIFNDGGTVVINNSTFAGNSVTRGNGGGAGSPGAADNGADAGGAIFSLNGHLTINDSTFSGNLSTGSEAAIVIQQTSTVIPTSFILNNTIIFNNGGTDANGNPIGTPKECSIAGSTIAILFGGAGNLIQNNDNCPGVVTTGDPLLGPLQYNRGFTFTMAIGPSSAAFNTADTSSSLSLDQRGIPRPSDGGFDIGAFEYCDFARDFNCNIVGDVQTEPLTILISPSGAGTTTPGAGTNLEVQNTITAVTATANPGYQFSTWQGNVAAPASAATTVVMNQSQTITAVFVPCGCAADVSTSITVTRGGYVLNPGTGRFVQTDTLTNNSANTITGPISLVLDGLSARRHVVQRNRNSPTRWSSPAGSPYINTASHSGAGAKRPDSIAVRRSNEGRHHLQHPRPRGPRLAIDILRKKGETMNRIFKMARIFKIVAYATLLLAWTATSARADSFNVSLNTSSLTGLGPQILLFELIPGDAMDNSVALSAFNFGTGAPVGAADYLGTTGVSGDLTSGIAMNDSGGLALFDQQFNPGASLSFLLSTTNNFSGVTPDEFSMFVCDLSFDCYSDDTAAGNLLGLGLTGGTLSPSSFTLNPASDQKLPAPVVTAVTTAPEPTSVLLLCFGLALLALMKCARSSGGTGKQRLLA